MYRSAVLRNKGIIFQLNHEGIGHGRIADCDSELDVVLANEILTRHCEPILVLSAVSFKKQSPATRLLKSRPCRGPFSSLLP